METSEPAAAIRKPATPARNAALRGFRRSATATTDVVLTAIPPHEFRAQVEQA